MATIMPTLTLPQMLTKTVLMGVCSSDKSHYQLPEGWEICEIEALCDVVRGGSPRPAGSEQFYNGSIPFLKVADLTNIEGVYVKTAEYSIKEAGLKKTRQIKAGTLILTNSGATLGVPKISKIDATINDGIAAFLYLDKKLIPYLYYYFESQTDYMRGINQGMGQPNLNTDIIKHFSIPLPPIAEQCRIVSAIESAFSVIDEIERNKSDLQTAVTSAKQKILSLAMCGKLVPQDENDEPASELLKRIKAERDKLIKAGKIKADKREKDWQITRDNSHYADLPQSWEVCPLYECLDYEQPQKYIVESVAYSDDYETPVLTANKGFIIGYTNEIQGICGELPVIIFDDFTTDSKYVDFQFKVKSSAMKILRSRIADVKYMFYFMQTVECDHATHKRYWISDFSLKATPLPPLAEQKRIVAAIESAFAVLDGMSEQLA